MKVEDYLAERLSRHGVRRFFGIPGGPSIPYMDAFRRKGIDFILTSHESSAAVMADVTARLTGVTGVCHGTFGPGAANLLTGVGGALLDRSPVIAFTSELPLDWLRRTSQMNIDHQTLFKAVTKATYRLSGENGASVIDDALEIANAEYPGPVHIGLPSDISGREVREKSGKNISAVTKPGDSLPEKIKVLIASSKRPILAVGLTAMRHRIGDDLVRFLSDHQVPVVITPMASGIIPKDHPCFAGVLFHVLSDRLRILSQEADLVIGLGYDPVEYNYESWIPSVPLVHFGTRETDMPYKGAMQFNSAPDKWFDALESLRSSPEMIKLAGEVRDIIKASLSDNMKGFSPVTALNILREELPHESIVTSDVGSHLHLMGQIWDVSITGKLVITNGWSSMGFGLPAAIAAAVCRKDLPIVCVTGDGGILMNAGEIMTARRLGIKIIVVVMADSELNLIKLKQKWKGITPYGISLFNGPFFDSDRFLGVRVAHVSDGDTMRRTIREALLSDSSTIIEAAIDPAVYSDLIVKV